MNNIEDGETFKLTIKKRIADEMQSSNVDSQQDKEIETIEVTVKEGSISHSWCIEEKEQENK